MARLRMYVSPDDMDGVDPDSVCSYDWVDDEGDDACRHVHDLHDSEGDETDNCEGVECACVSWARCAG